MVESIYIENFRCFRKTFIEGFKRINLIGGQNNVGKTALLEAIYLLNQPNSSTLEDILKKRKFENTHNSFFKEQLDKSFYYGFDKNNSLYIGTNANDKNAIIVMEISDLHIRFFEKRQDRDSLSNFRPENKSTTFYISSYVRKTNQELANDFEKADFIGKSHHLLAALQVIDNQIIEAKAYQLQVLPAIYVRKKGQESGFPTPLSLLGDAVNKIAEYILAMVATPNCVLLIDEIENGIHHTHQKEFWKMLFDLAIKFDVQVFATTHSREMTEAFAEIAENACAEEVAYFEMYRSVRTDEIVASCSDVALLQYKLHNKEDFRGEQ